MGDGKWIKTHLVYLTLTMQTVIPNQQYQHYLAAPHKWKLWNPTPYLYNQILRWFIAYSSSENTSRSISLNPQNNPVKYDYTHFINEETQAHKNLTQNNKAINIGKWDSNSSILKKKKKIFSSMYGISEKRSRTSISNRNMM